MAIIYSYPTVIPTANDLVLGTDVDQVDKPTKNFTVQSIIDLVTVSGNDLQAVLNNGNTATQNIVLTGNISATQFTDGTMNITGGVGTGFTAFTSTAITGTLQTAAQPNITSLGTLTSLKVGNNTPAITSLVTSFTAPGDNVKLATTKAIVDYVGTNPPGAESLAATLLVGNTTGATKIEVDNTGSGIDFIDDAKARFGTGNDLEIYHTGTESRISDVGTGSLVIQSSDIFLRTNGNENAVEAQANGTVKLFYDAAMKLSTTATGVSVTGNLGASGSGTFVNLINSGTYSDSSADVGSAGQILSSTGSGTNWINDPNPTPYTWIIEADSGAGSPYTVQTGDTIDFVGVGNVDTAWDNSSKELRISLGGTSISGTGADTQVVYWTGAQTVSGDAGMVYNDTSNNLTVSGTVQAGTLSDGTFSGASGTYTGGVSITSTTFVGALTGNADTATALASSGAITLTGDTSSTGGPHTYTSGGAVTIPTTIADTTVTAKVLTNLPSPTSSAIAATDTILAAMAKLQGQITGIPQGLVYKGTWNATTNTPTLASGTGTTGEFYIVSVAGSTSLDGITDWQVGDWAIFVEVGATDTWQKIDNTSAILGSGTANKIAKWTGSNTLATGLIEDDGTDVTIGNSGNLIVEGNTTLGNADTDTTTVKGPAHFEETLRADVGIGLGGATYGTAGQVLTSGGGAASVNTWTTPTEGTVTSVATGAGLTGGTITVSGTIAILYAGASNAILATSAETPVAADTIWFSDATDSNIKKSVISNLPFDQYTKWVLTGDTGTQDVESGNTVDIAGGTYITTAASATDTLTVTHDATTRSDTTSTDTPAFAGTFDAVTSVTSNATGHVTAIDVSTVTIPANPVFVGPANGTTDGVAGIVPAPGQATYNGGYFLRQDATWAIPPDLKGVETITTTAPIGGGGTATTVNITHDNSGVSAGTYDTVTVDAKGHVTAGTNPGGGGGGIFSGDQAIVTASSDLTFTLKRATTGTLIFDVWFTSETSTATSVAKKYVVAHSSDTAPVYNKILDTGPDGSNDFTVTFANATTTDTGDSVTCKIQAVGVAQNVGYTVQVGYDSTNALTFTAAS